MIEIKNQFICRIEVGPYKDFILTEDLISLSYMESAGLAIPFFSMSFILRNLGVLKYLNEGNVINVSMGVTTPELSAMQIRLISDISEIDYTLGSVVSIKGVLHLPKFIQLAKTNVFEGSSIEVMQKILSSHFGVVSNVDKTNDRQIWYQTGITDRQMIRDLWFHSYINSNTFMAVGFDNNNFRIKDIRKSLLDETPWIFSNNLVPTSPNSKIVHFGNFWTKNEYGSVNNCIGRGLEQVLFNVDTGEVESPQSKLKNFTAMGTNKLNLLDTNVKKYVYDYINDEVNPSYVLAEKQNLRNLMMYGNFKIFIPTAGQFKKFKLLDIAQLDDKSVGSRAAGRCFITRIFYQIVDKKFLTNLTLCKEGPSEMQGDDLVAT